MRTTANDYESVDCNLRTIFTLATSHRLQHQAMRRSVYTTREMIGFDGLRVTVMGLGRFGGGIGVVRWLVERGAHCVVTDPQSHEELAESIRAIDDCAQTDRVTLRLGGHDTRDFIETDLVIANPAVIRPWENPYLLAARKAGVPIQTEIELVCSLLNRRRIIGVTGTAGKSTTAAMIHHALGAGGEPSHLGGNIGGSLLPHIDSINKRDWIVLELSSFMLHWLGDPWGDGSPRFSPHIAVLTNLSANHLDWHGSFEHYAQSKENIVQYQQTGDHAIRWDMSSPLSANASTSKPIPLMIPGKHNQANARCALEAVQLATGRSLEELQHTLADFAGLPHRLQCVLERDGLCFFNDSKSTTPEATVLTVQSFENPSSVHLIAGGYDKGIDLTPIVDLLPSIAGLYVIGTTGKALVAAATSNAKSSQPRNVQDCGTLDRAVSTAFARMTPGDVLLLSPGCASWDQFTNYEERGKHFIELVQRQADRQS